MKTHKNILRICILPVLLALAATNAHAATTTWTGATDNNWNNATNWDNNLPASNLDTRIQTGDVQLNTGAADTLSLWIASAANSEASLTIETGATLNIGGGSAARIGTGANAKATVTQNGGAVSVSTNNLLELGGMSSGGTRNGGTATWTINAGTLTANNANGLKMSANTSNSSTSTFNQNGGTVTLGALTVGAGRKTSTSAGVLTNTAIYNINGGTLKVNGDYTHGWLHTSDTGNGYIKATTNITGSKATINIGGNLTLNQDNHSTSTLAFALDDGGVSKINVTGNATLAGTLTAGLKSGLAFTKTNTFTLIDAGGGLSGAFATGPNSALWTTSTESLGDGTRSALVLALATAAKKGATLDASAATSDTPVGITFDASTSGYVEIENLTAGQYITLLLNADAGSDKTVDDLVSWFNSNGVAATALSGPGNYNLSIAKTAAADGATAYLAWDLSGFNADATLSAAAIAATAIPEPAAWTAIAALTLLAGVAVARRLNGAAIPV